MDWYLDVFAAWVVESPAFLIIWDAGVLACVIFLVVLAASTPAALLSVTKRELAR